MSTEAEKNDHQDICTFCAEVGDSDGPNLYYELGICSHGERDYIREETPHFVVVPCIGALVERYVLVISKRHVLSAGWLNEDEILDLRSVIERWSSKISAEGGSAAVFEHGSYSFRDKGGACYDHCHIHIINTEGSVESFLEQMAYDIDMKPTCDWLRSAQPAIKVGEHSYLALSFCGNDYMGNSADAPSQFFRRHLARWLGADYSSWDWLVFPETVRVRHMIDTLRFSP